MPKPRSKMRPNAYILPWRVRILLSVLKGFVTNPVKAARYIRFVNIEKQSLLRFNLHIHGERFLRDFYEAAGSLGMKPFLFWGTLLGFVREGRFLAHDYDLDIGMMPPDFLKKNELIDRMLRKGYRLRLERPFFFSLERADGMLHLDVDLIYEHHGRMISFMRSEGDGSKLAHEFPKESFSMFEQHPFGRAGKVWVPKHSEELLTALYGDWKKPDSNYTYTTVSPARVKDPDALGIGEDNGSWSPF